MGTAFIQGQQTIQREIEAAFNQAGVHNISVSHITSESAPADTSFKVAANGREVELVFTRQDIEDSARAIDSSAATKVRVLVSRFTG
jgi:hypothetical protein